DQMVLGWLERLGGPPVLLEDPQDHRAARALVPPQAPDGIEADRTAGLVISLAHGHERLADSTRAGWAPSGAAVPSCGHPWRQGGSGGSPGAASGGALRSTARRAAWRSGSLSAESARSTSTTPTGSFFCRH